MDPGMDVVHARVPSDLINAVLELKWASIRDVDEAVGNHGKTEDMDMIYRALETSPLIDVETSLLNRFKLKSEDFPGNFYVEVTTPFKSNRFTLYFEQVVKVSKVNNDDE